MDLSQLPFFRSFSPELRQALMDSGSVRTYLHGESVFEAGENDTDFYMLVQGRIQIRKVSSGGQQRIMRTVQPGDTFALVSLFDEKPMFIRAEVLGDEAQVFVIERGVFHTLLQKYFELARFVIDGLVRRIRRYGEAMASMTVYYVDQRFIVYVLELSQKQGSDEVILPDSIATIAEQLGTAREVVSREISKMAKKGWIKKEGQKLQIVNRKALERRLEEV